MGKTFLIRETFGYKFTFEHAGLANSGLREQLYAWKLSICEALSKKVPAPANWLEAFDLLKEVIKSSKSGKKVIFIDEMPWMDTPKSGFVNALEFFWNSWASARKDILLIVCGSASSWIINTLFKNHGGLHNRVSHRISVTPFSLAECKEYVHARNMEMTWYDILECYMVLGGIPFYWSLLEKDKSVSQNIDNLFFTANGKLKYEFSELYESLFKMPEKYVSIVTALSKKKYGMTREEIVETAKIPNNGNLTKTLENLEHCGFIRSYTNYGRKSHSTLYQLIDNLTVFHFSFMTRNRQGNETFWSSSLNSPIRNAWEGLAFERVCLQHIRQIKKKLGINGISSLACAWQSRSEAAEKTGAQIDMLIDRADNVINVCEMKFSHDRFTINKKYDMDLRHKVECFRKAAPRKSLHLTMITTFGVTRNAYWNNVQSEVTANDLFIPD